MKITNIEKIESHLNDLQKNKDSFLIVKLQEDEVDYEFQWAVKEEDDRLLRIDFISDGETYSTQLADACHYNLGAQGMDAKDVDGEKIKIFVRKRKQKSEVKKSLAFTPDSFIEEDIFDDDGVSFGGNQSYSE
jgi:hypothetical protein